MKTIARVLCGCIILLSGAAFASDYPVEREARNAEIGQALAAQDMSRALALIDSGLAADEKNFGKEHPISLEWLRVKQAIHRRLEQKELAEATSGRLWTLWQTAYDTSSDPEILELIGDYAYSANENNAAVAAFKKALAIREVEAKDPQSSRALALTLYRLANAQFSADFGRLSEESLGYVKRAVELIEKIQGPDHHDLTPMLKLIAQDSNHSVGVAEVERLHKKIIRIEQNAHPALHSSVLNAQLSLADFYLETKRYDASLAITQPFLSAEYGTEAYASDFGLYTIRALMHKKGPREAASVFYKRLSLYLERMPEERYERFFHTQLSLLEYPGRSFPLEAWEGLAEGVYTLERNDAKGFPYLSLYLRIFNISKFERTGADRYLNNLEKIAEISSLHVSTQEPLARAWIEGTLDPVAKYYPEKSEVLARKLAANYQNNGDSAKAKALLETAEKYQREAQANKSRVESYGKSLRNNH